MQTDTNPDAVKEATRKWEVFTGRNGKSIRHSWTPRKPNHERRGQVPKSEPARIDRTADWKPSESLNYTVSGTFNVKATEGLTMSRTELPTMTDEVKVLSDDEVTKLANRPWYWPSYDAWRDTPLPSREVILTVAERDALCATVRALRDENSTLKKHWADTSEDVASAWLKNDELQSQLAQVTQEPLAATIDILEQRRRQLGAESIPEYSRTINFLQAIIDEKKKEYPPLGVAESKRREDG